MCDCQCLAWAARTREKKVSSLKDRFVGNLSIRPLITEWDKEPYMKVYFNSVSDRILYVSSADSGKTNGGQTAQKTLGFNASASLFATDWELHQGEHEDGDGPAAAERRPQPHRRHVGNGHQPALSNSRADPEAHRRGNPGDAGSTLSHTYYITIFVNYYLKYWILDQLGCSSVSYWVKYVPWILSMFSKTDFGAVFGVFTSGYSDFIFCNTARMLQQWTVTLWFYSSRFWIRRPGLRSSCWKILFLLTSWRKS